MESDGTRGSDATHTAFGHQPPSLGFDRYRMLQRVGEGGMGEVWLAEQTDPVHRRVALKVIKAGMDSTQVVTRFEAERQALALMDHPAIATVFDGGTTPEGRPYFAMEYVKGEPITVYCDRHRLATKERLELFTRVCEGVQHAHQKGVIHRDLKPSNVLVTEQNDRPTPKIIDFGIAKAITQPLSDRTMFTEFGVMLGTPEYMSPEQAELTGLDVDTRTDVYALGVLLYELLTGTLQFDGRALRQKGLDEIRRVIREVEPPRPSTRITELGPASTEAARQRNSEPARLATQLRGDLDWITMKALEKDRVRRYDTVMGLANDVRRHLQDEPVMAGPPSNVYRARKFVRRHRFGVGVATVLTTLVATFGIVMGLQTKKIAYERNRANREAASAKQVSSFLISLFEASKPGSNAPDTVTARDLLDAGVARVDRELRGDDGLRASLLSTMGQAYSSLGLRSKAATLIERALILRRQTFGPRHPEVAASLSAFGALSTDAAERKRLLLQALDIQRTVPSVEPDDLVRTLLRLGDTFSAQAKYHEAEPYAREALQVAQSAHPGPHETVMTAWAQVGSVRFHQEQYEAADQAFRNALAMATSLYGPDHVMTLANRENLADVQLATRHFEEAEKSFREILRIETPRLGKNHPDVGITLGNLGGSLHGMGNYREAEVYYRQALAIQRDADGNAGPDVAICLANLGETLDREGKTKDALDVLNESIRVGRDATGHDSPLVATFLTFYANALRHAGRFQEAERSARDALAINGHARGKDHARTREAEGALGQALAGQHRWSEAEPFLTRYAAHEQAKGVGGKFPEIALEIAAMYDAVKRPDLASQWRAKSVAARATGPVP
jgi:serine/threonine protein kinase/Tfp pilus assembly protein PilF